MVSQVKLDGPVCDYEGLMQVKRRIVRQIFDAAGHRSLDTQAYKVQMLLHLLHCACHVGCLLAHFAYRTAMLILVSLTWVSRCKLAHACLRCAMLVLLAFLSGCSQHLTRRFCLFRSGLRATSFGWSRTQPSASCGTCSAQLSIGAGVPCPSQRQRYAALCMFVLSRLVQAACKRNSCTKGIPVSFMPAAFNTSLR
jgi:hypothetical protein